MRLLILTIIFLTEIGAATRVVGQKHFTVIYRYQENEKERDSFYFPVFKPKGQVGEDLHYLGGVTGFTKSGNEAATTCVFSVEDTSCALILDLFGHASFLLPGDSIRIDLVLMPKVNNRFMLDSQYLSPWAHYFTYSGRNQFVYSLFDSLAYHYGPLSGIFARGVGFGQAGKNLDTFFQMTTQLFANRMAYLREYASKYHISGRVLDLAVAEIRSAYILNLTQPMANISDSFGLKNYPQPYIDTMNAWSPNREDLFLTTQNYSSAAYSYIRFYKVQLNLALSDRLSLFEKSFIAIEDQYQPGPLKEYLLAYCLLANTRTNDSTFISLLARFKSDFPDSRSAFYVDSIYADRINRTKVPLNRALVSNLIDTFGRASTMASLLGHKPVFVDCWASWCVPCIAQMPYTKQLEKKYGSKITFVYLSFDRDKDAWLRKSRELQFGESSYLLNGEFKSDFSLHFDITSIPRYLIFNKDGQLVTDDAPRPSRGEPLENILNKLSTQN